MNAIAATLIRDLTCAVAAVLISMVVSASFVQSTATVAGEPSVIAATSRST